jgi:hypothetical protein
MSAPEIRPTPVANQRRSQRVILAVPLRVSGNRLSGAPFVEHAKTLIVNAHGALLQLQEHLREGQTLSITNVTTGEGANGVAEVGVEFAEPSPRFWRVSFPPADWSVRSPEAKRFAPSPSPLPPPAKDPIAKK